MYWLSLQKEQQEAAEVSAASNTANGTTAAEQQQQQLAASELAKAEEPAAATGTYCLSILLQSKVLSLEEGEKSGEKPSTEGRRGGFRRWVSLYIYSMTMQCWCVCIEEEEEEANLEDFQAAMELAPMEDMKAAVEEAEEDLAEEGAVNLEVVVLLLQLNNNNNNNITKFLTKRNSTCIFEECAAISASTLSAVLARWN